MSTPSFRTYPEAYHRARAKEAIELAASIGMELDDYQSQCLKDSLGVDEADRWTANEVGLVVPRQNGKTITAEIRALAGLCLWNEPLQVWTAHRFLTAEESFLRIVGYLENTPDLSKLLKPKGIHRSAADKSITMKSGARLRFIARNTATGRGLTGDVIYLDEAFNLDDAQMASLFYAKSARPNSQVWYLSSAPHPDSFVLRKLMKRGRSGDSPRLAYTEFSASPDLKITDPTAWAAANPAYPDRITDQAILDELEATTDWDFAVERLGQVDLSEQSTTGPINVQAWEDSLDLVSQPDGSVAFGIDVKPDGSSAVIAAAGRRADGLSHFEIIDQRPGTQWIVDRLAELFDRWQPSCLVLDLGSRAGSLYNQLLEKGFGPTSHRKLEIVTAREVAHSSVGLADDVNQGRVRHLGDGRLTAAVAGARTRPLAGSWAFKAETNVDISPLIAVTLARHGVAIQAVEHAYAEPYIGSF